MSGLGLPPHWATNFFLAGLCLELQANAEALSRLQLINQVDRLGDRVWTGEAGGTHTYVGRGCKLRLGLGLRFVTREGRQSVCDVGVLRLAVACPLPTPPPAQGQSRTAPAQGGGAPAARHDQAPTPTPTVTLSPLSPCRPSPAATGSPPRLHWRTTTAATLTRHRHSMRTCWSETPGGCRCVGTGGGWGSSGLYLGCRCSRVPGN